MKIYYWYKYVPEGKTPDEVTTVAVSVDYIDGGECLDSLQAFKTREDYKPGDEILDKRMVPPPSDSNPKTAQRRIDVGIKFPYDAGGANLDDDHNHPPPSVDKARETALGILADLCDRRGISHELEAIDHDIRVELVADLAQIIRVGMA
jgi:hypothetical protein